jgi:DNA damage-binding protein 1
VTSGKEEKGVIVLGQGSYLSVVDSWKNIAPIMDAVLVDLDGSGQVHFESLFTDAQC